MQTIDTNTSREQFLLARAYFKNYFNTKAKEIRALKAEKNAAHKAGDHEIGNALRNKHVWNLRPDVSWHHEMYDVLRDRENGGIDALPQSILSEIKQFAQEKKSVGTNWRKAFKAMGIEGPTPEQQDAIMDDNLKYIALNRD